MKDSRSRSTWWPVLLPLAVALVLIAPAARAQDGDPVAVSLEVTGKNLPGKTVRVKADVEINDGSTVVSYAWMQTGGLEANLTATDTDRVRVKLPARNVFRQYLIHTLSEPPIGPDELPPNVPPPPEEFPGGLQDRFQVVGMSPFAIEETGLVVVEVAVTTTSGVYHAEAEIHVDLPWKPTAGIRNVPIGIPVVLYGKDQGSYNWALARPGGSSASLGGRGSRSPEFTPDVPGEYVVTVTDQATGMPVELTVYAGNWRGVIVAQDDDGRPLAEGLCTACHSALNTPSQFADWPQTGHAEIFTDLLNTNTHYSGNCWGCHTVGYDPDVDNGGFDEADDFADFLGAGLLNNPGDNWTQVLDEFPDTAQLANIQCENCHGPANSEPGLDTLAHGWIPGVEGEPRVSLSSDVCATCHGEPLRHARFQQWQLSAHSNYELAIEEGGSGNCSRCHTGNGFLEWLPILLGEEPGDPTASISVNWTTDETHPQTCVTCHDPHDIGTTSGNNTNVNMRIAGSTPDLIAGFKVVGAGRAALCMTCHNSRRGLRNDANFGEFVGTSEAARAPHGSAQTDVLMGENAYNVNVGVRGPHSFIEDSCVACHMQVTPPPDLLSYNQGGANHTFFASTEICSDCHEEVISAETLQTIVSEILADVQGQIEGAILDLMADQIALGSTIDIDGTMVTDTADIADIEFGEARGRHAITVTFTGGAVVGPVRLPDVEVVQPAPLATVDLYDLAPEGLIKAGWNWNLINNDGSKGVHNPTFALAVLDAARDGIGGGGGPRTRLPF